MSVAKEFRSPKPQKLTKSQDMTRPTFSKLTGTFKLHQWTQTKTKVPLCQLMKLMLVINRGLNRKEMYLWAKLCCIMPPVNAFYLMSTFPEFLFLFCSDQNNSYLTKFFIKNTSSKITTPVNPSLSREREGGRVHPSVPNCGPKLKHSKLVNS